MKYVAESQAEPLTRLASMTPKPVDHFLGEGFTSFSEIAMVAPRSGARWLLR
jgi:hypothetical protein